MIIRTLCHWTVASLATIALLATPLAAQTPATPAAAASAAQPPLHVPAPAAPGFWGSVGAPLGKCKTCWHNCSLRKLLKNGMAPLSAATGGMIGGGHDQPPPPPAGVPAAPPPPPPAVNAAAKIKVEAAQAEARVEAVRYLATVDCHWYPEAEAGLIASLRADRSECVRLAAAQSLARGCCCTKKTLAALQICAAGSNADGNPGERCVRVRWAALHAMQVCLSQCDATHFRQPAYQDRPESPEDPLTSTPAADALPEFYRRVDAIAPEQLLHNAQQTVAVLARGQTQVASPTSEPRGGLYGIWAASRSEPIASPAEPTADDYYATTPAATGQAVTAHVTGYPLARPLGPPAAYGQPGGVLPVGSVSYENVRQ